MNQTAIERQRALDYLHLNPWAAAHKVFAALGWERRTGTSRLRDMVMRGELERRDALVERLDKNSRTMVVHTCEYRALVLWVLGEEANGWRALRNQPKQPEVVEPVVPTPRRTGTFDKPNRPPLRNQGGQGCVSTGPWRGSSLDIV